MSENTYGKGTSLSKILLYTLFFGICLLLFYNYFKNTSFSNGENYTSIPKEMQIKYIPAEFDFNVDDETTLAILTNPERYQREFNDLIYNFNLSMLNHVANRMNLSDSIKMEIEPIYQKQHPFLRQMYYNDFLKLRDTSANMYESWYGNNFNSATEALNEVASNYSCYLVNQVIMNLVISKGGKIAGIGNSVETPCMIAMQESLKPMIRRLEQKAAIKDFSSSKGMLEEKVEKAIAELATMEVRDRKGLNKQLQTKIWGYAVSSTDIEVSAISVLKVGFKLDKFFEINLDEGRKRIYVNLPAPQVLSHEVYPKIDKLDVGWMRELSNEDFNKNFNVLRQEFRRDAIEDRVYDKAKDQADELMKLMLSPIITQLKGNYKIVIRYQENPKSLADQEFSQQNQGGNIEN
ncbi:MAG: DUF4230 domain-containing protein [Saprospiraceae bacterium]